MEILVEAAMVDWAMISDEALPDVCARARIIAAGKNSNFAMPPVATTADVLRAKEIIAEEYRTSQFRIRKANYERLVKEGRIIPPVVVKDLKPEEREEFWNEFYKSAGLPRGKA